MPKVREWIKQKEYLRHDILKNVEFSYPVEYRGYLKIFITLYSSRYTLKEVEQIFRETVCDSPWLIMEQVTVDFDTYVFNEPQEDSSKNLGVEQS